MRSWRPPCPFSAGPDVALPSTVQQRGLCLMTIEFLTRFPAAECVVTCPSLPFWDTVFDLFPKTFFQVFLSPPEDPPRPNVLRHFAKFDAQLAARFGARGAPYNLMFTMEDVEAQMITYLHGSPAAALLLVTRQEQDYLEGELMYPLYCSLNSGFCALVPAPGPARAVSYAGYGRAMLDFHSRCRYPGSGYDRAMEDLILAAYVQGVSGVSEHMAQLMVESTRGSLPRLEPCDVVFAEPHRLPPPGSPVSSLAEHPDCAWAAQAAPMDCAWAAQAASMDLASQPAGPKDPSLITAAELEALLCAAMEVDRLVAD
jgi:hypothetical protein